MTRDELHAKFRELGYTTNAQTAELLDLLPQPIELNIIRQWPDGFQRRLQHVWMDLVSQIPNVKLYDLQRVLAEFGFTLTITEAKP